MIAARHSNSSLLAFCCACWSVTMSTIAYPYPPLRMILSLWCTYGGVPCVHHVWGIARLPAITARTLPRRHWLRQSAAHGWHKRGYWQAQPAKAARQQQVELLGIASTTVANSFTSRSSFGTRYLACALTVPHHDCLQHTIEQGFYSVSRL